LRSISCILIDLSIFDGTTLFCSTMLPLERDFYLHPDSWQPAIHLLRGLQHVVPDSPSINFSEVYIMWFMTTTTNHLCRGFASWFVITCW
jgi:hypothetical protein